MSKAHEKTPIMVLQEFAAKRNPKDLPIYTELMETPEEYAGSDLRFFIHCQALGFSSVGGGVTKKIAKHTAAEKLLNKLFNNDDDDVEKQPSIETNYISDLLDYCVVKGYPKPEFTCISSCGPSHAPKFTFKCKLNSIERTAEAKSKQLAKQLSAKEVYDVIKLSFPDIEKKLAVVQDTPQQQDIKIRQKITTYLDLKKKNKDSDFKGTSIKDRHNFFKTQEPELVECLLEILRANIPDGEKFQKLIEEFETMWPVKIEKFLDTDMMKFELEIDYEKFNCVIIGAEDELKSEVLQYFYEMMDVEEAPEQPESDDSSMGNVSLMSFRSGNSAGNNNDSDDE